MTRQTITRAEVHFRLGLLAGSALLTLLVMSLSSAGATDHIARDGAYTVRSGDTLFSIARRHGVDWRALAEANGLTDANHIEVGQVLQVTDIARGHAADGTHANPQPRTNGSAQANGANGARNPRVVPMLPPEDEVLAPAPRRPVIDASPVLSSSIPVVAEGRRYPNVPVETTVSELIAVSPLALATSLSELISDETIDQLRQLGFALVPPSVIEEATGLGVALDPATISVRVTVPPSLRRTRAQAILGTDFDESTIRVYPSNFAVGTTVGLVVTDDLNGGQDPRGQLALAGFANLGGLRGVNLDYSGTYTFTGGDTQFRRGPLVAFVDDPERVLRYSAGDLVTAQPRLAGSRALLGVGLDRSYVELQPTRIVRPTGRRSFVLEREATVEIYANDALVSRFVSPPGPIDLTDIPLANITNNVRIVVEDSLGRRELDSFSLASDLSLLSVGLDEFSVSLGVLRDETLSGFDYSSDIVASAFYTRGLTEQITASAHIAYTPLVTNAGASLAFGGLGGVFLLEGALSESDFSGSGYAASLTFRADGILPGVNDALTFGLDHTSEDYATISDTGAFGNLRYDLAVDYRFDLSSSIQAGLGVNASERYGVSGTDRLVTLSLSRRFDFFQIGLSARYGETALGNDVSGVFLSLSRIFGPRTFGIASYDTRTRTSRAEFARSRGIRVPDYNYRVSVEDTDGDTRVSGRVGYSHSRYEADLNAVSRINAPSGSSGDTVTARLQSGFGYADGTFGIGRDPGRGFFMVRRHPTLSDARLDVRRGSLSGQVAATGERFGPVLTRADLPYRPVTFSVGVVNAPIGYDTGDTVFGTLPGARSGVVVTVGRDAFRTAIATLSFEGAPLELAYGRLIALATGEEQTVFTNRAGRVALPNLEPGRYRVEFTERAVGFEFEIADNDEVFLNLGSIALEP